MQSQSRAILLSTCSSSRAAAGLDSVVNERWTSDNNVIPEGRHGSGLTTVSEAMLPEDSFMVRVAESPPPVVDFQEGSASGSPHLSFIPKAKVTPPTAPLNEVPRATLWSKVAE